MVTFCEKVRSRDGTRNYEILRHAFPSSSESSTSSSKVLPSKGSTTFQSKSLGGETLYGQKKRLGLSTECFLGLFHRGLKVTSVTINPGFLLTAFSAVHSKCLDFILQMLLQYKANHPQTSSLKMKKIKIPILD